MQAVNQASTGDPGQTTMVLNDRLPPMRVRPLRALRAFRNLMADKEDTAQVFEIMQALNGRSTARSYQRLIATVSGGRIAYERQELAAYLSDWKTSLPRDWRWRAGEPAEVSPTPLIPSHGLVAVCAILMTSGMFSPATVATA
jgi:hypothetical protein